MELLENELFREMEAVDTLDCVKATLRALEEDEMLQSKRVRIGDLVKWFYRPIP